MSESVQRPLIAIACGGTGGHLFPGQAVGSELVARGARVLLIISQKAVDQQALQAEAGWETVALPGVGLTRGRLLAFLVGFCRAYWAARRLFTTTTARAPVHGRLYGCCAHLGC